MRAILWFFSAILVAGPAAASGGFLCEAEDEKVSLGVNGGVTRGMGSAVFSLQGKLELHDDGLADDLRRTEFERAHLAQYWLDGSELRLLLYREREGAGPHGYAELTLKAVASEGGSYSGDYVVDLFDMTDAANSEGKTARFEGRVSCSVE
ncbi:MAG: hypothetical protein WBA88_05595 [Pseudaminobacter sp.]